MTSKQLRRSSFWNGAQVGVFGFVILVSIIEVVFDISGAQRQDSWKPLLRLGVCTPIFVMHLIVELIRRKEESK